MVRFSAFSQRSVVPAVTTSYLVGKEVASSRYQCNTCHVQQVDAKPLVLSTFVGTPLLPKMPWEALRRSSREPRFP